MNFRSRVVLTVAAAVIGGMCAYVGATNAAADLRVVAESINATLRANHYRPALLQDDRYRQLESDALSLAATAPSDEAFRTGFNALWKQGPFSHVALLRADESADERYARMDTAPGGENAVSLDWRGEAAVLTVTTMSGTDTIEAIESAYDKIAARKPARLIIDLRRNGGGAFAVVPLVGHLIAQPLDAGVFASAVWYRDHDAPPGPRDFPSATPWRGYSLRAFQAQMLAQPLTGYRIDPMQPHYPGPVYVLTSARSVSAAEIAADVLKATGRATVVGERTPGAVLSSKRFDIPGGFHLLVPVADYFSIANGRIEGVGVAPDIAVDADHALDVALGPVSARDR